MCVHCDVTYDRVVKRNRFAVLFGHRERICEVVLFGLQPEVGFDSVVGGWEQAGTGTVMLSEESTSKISSINSLQEKKKEILNKFFK